ncbi:flagellar motor protein MotB [Thalassoglobus polymorphus]|uniref:Flagellar motor protein MotB n=1 Tax=Thalassoglobus polymorphus TaxID=2527994 RepID=A0A517QMJ7_9PLAN|nr:flagellar motor protein MotB [Thalassoglobus polymorphus]QDT32825.1 flagellar motor protein MotB [Thalassoglobus polymorphus]
MRRSKKSATKNGEIPRWFVTYSDVITLLMTFFILLLTFSSSEPEGFELMQESLFGSGGSASNVGVKVKDAEKETLVVRFKPPSSRMTSRGSEIPPMYTDPVTEAASKGLSALEENNDLANFERFSLDVSIHLFTTLNGEPTEVALRQLSLLANQMKRLPLELTMSVDSPEHLTNVAQLAELLTSRFDVPPGRIGIAIGDAPKGLQLSLRLEQ